MAAKAKAKEKGKWIPPWAKKEDAKKPAPKKKTTPKMKKKC